MLPARHVAITMELVLHAWKDISTKQIKRVVNARKTVCHVLLQPAFCVRLAFTLIQVSVHHALLIFMAVFYVILQLTAYIVQLDTTSIQPMEEIIRVCLVLLVAVHVKI
jgi:hypothetical protein